MTLEQQESLKRELDGAMESGDDSRVRCAQANILLALMDCQRKTSERVKKLQLRLLILFTSGGTLFGYAADKIDWLKFLFH